MTAGQSASVRRLVHRLPVTVFLTLTFVWAWVLWGYWIPAMPEGGLVFSAPFLACAIIGGLAPSVAALLTSYLMSGKQGPKELLPGLGKWRMTPEVFLASFVLVPAIALCSSVLQWRVIGPLQWTDPGLLPLGLIWPIFAALGEELGWRGFMLPRLQDRIGVIAAALVVGLVWGLWHLPSDYIALKSYGMWFWLIFLINGPVLLTGHALIMSWIWNRSRRNLLAMVAYHYGLTATAILFPTVATGAVNAVISGSIGAAVVWACAIGIFATNRGRQQ